MTLGKRSYIAISTLLAAGLVASAFTLAKPVDSRAANESNAAIVEGTPIHVRLDNAVDSGSARSGEEFHATVSEPVQVDGRTVIPQGAPATGLIVEARESGHLMHRPMLRLELTQVVVDGKSYDLRTGTTYRVGHGHGKRNLAWIGGSGAGGAIIGAIAAGGKGALIGGPIGAGVGTAVAYMTGKHDIHLPAETPLTFRLSEPVSIDVAS